MRERQRPRLRRTCLPMLQLSESWDRRASRFLQEKVKGQKWLTSEPCNFPLRQPHSASRPPIRLWLDLEKQPTWLSVSWKYSPGLQRARVEGKAGAHFSRQHQVEQGLAPRLCTGKEHTPHWDAETPAFSQEKGWWGFTMLFQP